MDQKRQDFKYWQLAGRTSARELKAIDRRHPAGVDNRSSKILQK
jgi:hypothetical protein